MLDRCNHNRVCVIVHVTVIHYNCNHSKRFDRYCNHNCACVIATPASVNNAFILLLNVAGSFVFEQADLVASLVGFVDVLTQHMHRSIPGSTVIWYDSVIDSGELKWQNEVNALNRSALSSSAIYRSLFSPGGTNNVPFPSFSVMLF